MHADPDRLACRLEPEPRTCDTRNARSSSATSPSHNGDDSLKSGPSARRGPGGAPIVVTALPWPSYLMGIEDLQSQLDVEMKERFAVVHDQLRDLERRDSGDGEPVAPPRPCTSSPRARAPQILVLGSSHRGPVGRTLAGSVGESLMHGAPCAIAIAPRGYAPAKPSACCESRSPSTAPPRHGPRSRRRSGSPSAATASLTVIAVADYPHYGYAEPHGRYSAPASSTTPSARKSSACSSSRSDAFPTRLEHDSRLLTGDAGRGPVRSERRVRPDGHRLARLRPAAPHRARQHDPQADPLVGLSGARAPARQSASIRSACGAGAPPPGPAATPQPKWRSWG